MAIDITNDKVPGWGNRKADRHGIFMNKEIKTLMTFGNTLISVNRQNSAYDKLYYELKKADKYAAEELTERELECMFLEYVEELCGFPLTIRRSEYTEGTAPCIILERK